MDSTWPPYHTPGRALKTYQTLNKAACHVRCHQASSCQRKSQDHPEDSMLFENALCLSHRTVNSSDNACRCFLIHGECGGHERICRPIGLGPVAPARLIQGCIRLRVARGSRSLNTFTVCAGQVPGPTLSSQDICIVYPSFCTLLSQITTGRMSRPAPNLSRAPTAPFLTRPKRALSSTGARPNVRRPTAPGTLPRTGAIHSVAGAPKAQRTSKTTQKLVLLPSEVQTKPLIPEDEEELQHGYETDRGIRDVKSVGERMSKEQRQKAGFKRITAYCVAEGFKMKILASFLKREHNVQPRIFDEAMYTVRGACLAPT